MNGMSQNAQIVARHLNCWNVGHIAKSVRLSSRGTDAGYFGLFDATSFMLDAGRPLIFVDGPWLVAVASVARGQNLAFCLRVPTRQTREWGREMRVKLPPRNAATPRDCRTGVSRLEKKTLVLIEWS